MRTRTTNPGGFTLIEVIVAVAILAMLITMTVPRLTSHENRVLQLTADRIADLMMVYAQRGQLSGKPAGLWHDVSRNWIVLMVLEVDPAVPQDPALWRPDPAARPVKLPEVIPPAGVFVTANGVPRDITQWPVATSPGEPRETIEINLLDTSGRSTTIILPSHAIAPYRLDDTRPQLIARTPIDLDSQGRAREDW